MEPKSARSAEGIALVRAAGSIVFGLIVLCGCSRTHYRLAADAETYATLGQKIAGRPWAPSVFTIAVPPSSRLFDPTPPDAPLPPPPVPRLYGYEIPELPERRYRPDRRDDSQPDAETLPDTETLPDSETLPEPGETARRESLPRKTMPAGTGPDLLPVPGPVEPSSRSIGDSPDTAEAADSAEPRRSSRRTRAPPAQSETTAAGPRSGQPRPQVVRASHVAFEQPPEPIDAEPVPPPPRGQAVQSRGELPLVEISDEAWQAIPRPCLSRMLEFERVREEYRRTFGNVPDEDGAEQAQQLSLESIIQLALLNSREYQTQKESLYRAALALTLQRFDYALKFSPGGVGADLDYRHNRSGGRTVNTLAVPSRAQLDKMLVTGGTIVARFANDVVLTFNGPDGFASDIGSELLFDLSQSLIQRDVLFESLTQAERNVIYAARNYARFRKVFFFQFASDYYALIRTYRQVEIDSQNYFSLSRALTQAEAELLAGIQARFQVDQIEQSMLQGRSRLISTCVGLERSLDRLKFSMGIPPETPIDLDLSELRDLTLRDEVAVAGELVGRSRQRLVAERRDEPPQRIDLINAAILLAERMDEWLDVQQRLGRQQIERGSLAELRARLEIDKARLVAAADRAALLADVESSESPAIRLFQRTMDLVDSLLELVTRQLDLDALLGTDPQETAAVRRQDEQLRAQAAELRARLSTALAEADLEEIPRLLEEAERLLAETEELVRTADLLLGTSPEQLSPAEQLERTLEQVDALLAMAAERLEATAVGLVPVEIEVDDAMMTALVLRLDLMNERGFLGDDRRAVKLAADDLRSVLNLNASQVIRTDRNRPLDFTFDESTTRLGLSLDLPFNRKAQRNNYRLTLINYHVALRSLMQLEDNIKLAVRDDLRNLGLGRTQYQISVASAALAAERVVSTRLELTLGFPGVAARDFLEAQDAFQRALGAVADNHIGYIVDRTQFFLDLELLQVGPDGFWEGVYDEDLQPTPNYQLPPGAGAPYGELPPRLWYSKELKSLFPQGP